jgi:hypothetical protein
MMHASLLLHNVFTRYQDSARDVSEFSYRSDST